MNTKIISAKSIHPINYLEFMNRKIFEHNALATPKPDQKPRTNSSLQVETKNTSLGAHTHDGQSLEPSIQLLKTCQKHAPKLDLGLLRIYSLQATRCHRSTPYTLYTTSMTSEGEHNILTSFGLLTGTPFKSESGLLRIYSLQCLTQNSLKRRVRQPLCDPSYLRKLEEWENQSLDDLLDLGPRPWGISRGVTDQHPTHDSITNLRQLFFMFTSLEQIRNYFDGSTKSIL